jgi:hypothetical protein
LLPAVRGFFLPESSLIFFPLSILFGGPYLSEVKFLKEVRWYSRLTGVFYGFGCCSGLTVLICVPLFVHPGFQFADWY